MKNFGLGLLFVFILPCIGISQADMPVIIVSTIGKVQQNRGFLNKSDIYSGSLVAQDASMDIQNGASVLIFHDSRFMTIKGPQISKMADVIKELNTAPLVQNFDPRFGEFIKANMSIANNNMEDWHLKLGKNNGDGWGVNDPKSRSGWGVNDPKSRSGWGVNDPKSRSGWGVTDPKSRGGWGVNDPKSRSGWGVTDPKSRGGWGVNDPKSRSGWGIEDMTIEPSTPGGLYPNAKVNLSWLKTKDIFKYLFCIVDNNLQVVHSQEVQDTTVSIDLSTLNLIPESSYYWQAIAFGSKAVTPPISFNIAGDELMNEVLALPTQTKIDVAGNDLLKGMMLATSYEITNMYISAYQQYDNLLKTNPTDNMLRINYAAFCLRMGQSAKADAIMKKFN